MGKRVISSLEEHPNLAEILGVLAQLPHIADADLPRLAAAWTNTVPVAQARDRALRADSPLVLEVLAAFEAVQSLFAEDLRGEEGYLVVEPAVTAVALKAIRDAVAAAYARPVLRRGEYAALLRPWRTVFPARTLDQPDLGPNAARVSALLGALPRLAVRCHDPQAAGLFRTLHRVATTTDGTVRSAAREETWRAAVLTSRRRIWGLVRRNGIANLARYCGTCRRPPGGAEEQTVLELCLDAACALLVADAVDDALVEVLTLPLGDLIPPPRSPAAGSTPASRPPGAR